MNDEQQYEDPGKRHQWIEKMRRKTEQVKQATYLEPLIADETESWKDTTSGTAASKELNDGDG